jgi:hypothetical protein
VSKIWDDLEAREMMGVEDPIGMRQRIKAMQLAEMQTQQEVGAGQQQGQPGGGGGAPPSTGTPPPGPSGGPPPQVFRPPGLQQAGQVPPPGSAPPGSAAGGTAMGVTREAVEKALEKIAAKLKGTAYAVGDLATGHSQHATVAVSDGRDYSMVLAALKAIDPGAKVRKVPEDKIPREAVRVA